MTYAIDAKTGILVPAGATKGIFTCPLCRCEVHPRGGQRRAPYFAHARTPSHARRRCRARDRDILALIVERFDIEL